MVIAGVLDDSFAHFECQIQSAECRIALLKILDDPQRMQVVVKGKSVPAHRGIERFFSGVTEWRMSDVMHQCQSLDEIDIESELSGDGARNLRDLKSMRQAVSKVVGIAAGEDLRLCLKAAESARVNYAVAIALEI